MTRQYNPEDSSEQNENELRFGKAHGKAQVMYLSKYAAKCKVDANGS
jgi:hypothetical protein